MMTAPGIQVSAPISSTGHYQSMGQPPPMMNSVDGMMQLQSGINLQQQHQQRMNANTGPQPYPTEYSTHGAYMPQSQSQQQPYLCNKNFLDYLLNNFYIILDTDMNLMQGGIASQQGSKLNFLYF